MTLRRKRIWQERIQPQEVASCGNSRVEIELVFVLLFYSEREETACLKADNSKPIEKETEGAWMKLNG